MFRLPLAVLVLCIIYVLPTKAQKGTAPNGYYPNTYSGATFTGVVEPGTDPMEVALVSTDGRKSERFAGRLESECKWTGKDGTLHISKVSDLPRNSVLTAFYQPVTRKSGGQKIPENTIIAISLASINGTKISREKRLILFCTDRKFMMFHVFNGVGN